MWVYWVKSFSSFDNYNVLEIKTSEETSMDYLEEEFNLNYKIFKVF